MDSYSGCMGLGSPGRLQSVGQLHTATSETLGPQKMHVISVLVGKDREGKEAT